MAKYRKSQHEPLFQPEGNAIQEEEQEFSEEIHDVGQTLRELRENKGWSPEELGKKIGVDQELILKFENGEQPISKKRAEQFSKIFDVPINHFFL